MNVTRLAVCAVAAAAALSACAPATTPPHAATLTFAAIGDSVSAGVGADPGHGYTAMLGGPVVDDNAVDGATLARMLGDPPELNTARLTATHPGVVIVMLGINDRITAVSPAMYESQYSTLLDQVCAASPDSAVLVVGEYPIDLDALSATNPGAIPSTHREPQSAYNTEARQAATGHGVGYTDVTDSGVLDHIGPDGAHPNQAGHDALAAWITSHLPLASRCGVR